MSLKNKLKSLWIIAIAFLGGVFYRMGGSGNFPRWIRLAGQQACIYGTFWVLGLILLTWQAILGTFLSGGVAWAESTYFKKKGTDAKWYNWALVGAVFGIIPLPYCALTQSHWLGFGLRLSVTVGLTVWWQQSLSKTVQNFINSIIEKYFFKTIAPIGKDITDEVGRGFINIITLPILLIG